MNEATDVLQAIDQLRRDLSGYHGQLKAHDDLRRHCDHQRDRIAQLEGLYAKTKAENAKLRKLVKGLMGHVMDPPCEGCIAEMSCDCSDLTQCDEWLFFEADARRLGIEVGE